jgi:ATP/maltotriose-dependent transcriptional regulator MalT
MRSLPLRFQRQKSRLVTTQEQLAALPDDDIFNALKGRISLKVGQLAAAFELPFQNMGVRTADYRQEIEEAIHALYRHDADQQTFALCLDRLLQAAKQNWTSLAAFSPREREILELLLQNISYREMSSRLHVSMSTIKTHVYHVFQKLEISNREEAICLIRERGWFFVNECNTPPINRSGKPPRELHNAPGARW